VVRSSGGRHVAGQEDDLQRVPGLSGSGRHEGPLSPRSFTIATYALCGFANFGSMAIMIGGIGGLVPSRRKDIAHYGFRA
jgi:concentrative nucleoside transporter, CNT family